MSDLVFPSDLPGIRLQCERTPIYKTGVMEAVSGQEYRAAWASRPRNRWRLTIEFLRSATPLEWQEMVSFYQRHGGQWDSFLFTDPDDNAIGDAGMLFGLGDGAETAFQIQRTLLPEERVTGRIWFSYAPGDDYAAMGGVFARAGTATYVNEQGVLATALAGVLRDGHWIIPNGETERVRTVLTEPAGTNRCLRSQEFDTWTDLGGVTVTADATTAPDGTVTADLLTASTDTSARLRDVTFPADGTQAISFFLKYHSSLEQQFYVRDFTAGVNRHIVTVTWTAGVPVLTSFFGSGQVFESEELADGWWRVAFTADNVVAANSNQVRFYPDTDVGTNATYAWGAQAENASVHSSYMATAAATASRVADDFYFPFGVAPQLMTAYLRGINTGSYVPDGVNRRVLHVGASNIATDARFALGKNSSNQHFAQYDDGTTEVASQASFGATVKLLDEIEHRAVLSATWTARSAASVNGAAETVANASGASGSAASWAAGVNRLYLTGALSSNNGRFAYRNILIAGGDLSMDTLREYAAADASPVQFWPSMRDGYEPITEFNGDPEIYLAGVLQVEGTDYTIDDQGVVTFTAPPPVTTPIRWFGSYYKRVRFNTDALTSRRLFTSMWDAQQVDLIQVI